MRLIDPIGLKQALVVSAILEDKKTIEQIIDEQPTIEERKKGEWIPHPNREFKEWDVCTACGVGCKRRDYEDDGMTEYNYPYCPNCGAQMEN